MEVFDRHGLLVTRFSPEVCPDEAEAALGLLMSLKVRRDDWKPVVSYQRPALPLKWARIAGTSMDVKDVMLARQMNWEGRVYDSDGFTLKHAVLAEDMYTGLSMVFEQAADRSEFQIQLDHLVSLSDAFTSGGWRWKPSGYNWPRFANDAGNLIAVSRVVNAAKGDKNAAQWQPGNMVNDFRRRFVVLQVQVKARYKLSVTQSESAVIRQVLTSSVS